MRRRVIKIKSVADQLNEALKNPMNAVATPKKDPNFIPADPKKVKA